MTAIDLFSGGGGFHEAAKQAGIPVIFASEINKFAAHNYQTNYGLKPWGDITKISAEDIPPHSLLMAGFPCQAFSIAGKRRGLDDARGTLFYEVARILEAKKPRFALLENVKGLLSHYSALDMTLVHKGDGLHLKSSQRVRTMDIIHNVLISLGYWVQAKVLNSKDYGVPQNRERIFLACFKNKEDFDKFRWPAPVELTTVLQDLLEEEVLQKFFVSQKMIPYVESRHPKFLKINPDISPCLMARYGKINSDAYVSVSLSLSLAGKELKLQGLLNGKNTQYSRIYGIHGLACCLSANGGGLGTKTGLYDVSSNLEQTIIKEAANNRAGIDEAIARTITTQGGTNGRGSFINGRNIRRLTPRECARLQGFPDSYKIDVSDNQAYKIFGNAVTVNVAAAIINRIKEL